MGPPGGASPFAALGLAARADLTDDEVRSAWRRVAAATHPDRGDGGDPGRFAVAAAAYTVLRTRSGRGEALADLASPSPSPARPRPGRPRPRPPRGRSPVRPPPVRPRPGRRPRARFRGLSLVPAGGGGGWAPCGCCPGSAGAARPGWPSVS